MQYPSFPMRDSSGDFPHHSAMAAYLGTYADAFGLRPLIRFGTTVERVGPAHTGGGASPSMTARVAAMAPLSPRPECSGAPGSRPIRAASAER